MRVNDQPTRTRPDAVAPSAPSTGAGDAVNALLGRGARLRQDSRRIGIGLLALAAVGVVVLNLGVYQGAQSNLLRQRWDQLVTNTDRRRDEVRDQLSRFENEARFVADQPRIREWLAELQGDGSPAARAELGHELARASDAFGYRAIRAFDAQGRPLDAAWSRGGDGLAQAGELARAAAARPDNRTLDFEREGDGAPVLTLAIPVRLGDGGGMEVLVFESGADAILLPVLMEWPGYNAAAGAYLVRKEGGRVEFITAPPRGVGVPARDHVPENARFARAAAMAVEGVESSVELRDHDGRRQAIVTRYLPEIGWGLVGQVDRAAMLDGMRSTLYGLLVFDLAIVLLAGTAFWLWRRQYESGLARREMEVTQRHAARVRAIFDTAFDAIMTFDRSGRVRTVNRGAQALLGRPAGDLEGQPIHRFLHWGDPGAARAELPAPGTVVRAEAIRADGSILPVEFSLGSSGAGEDLLYTAIVRDISERVEAERRIQEFADGLEASNRRLEELNAQLEEASRLKSEVHANTSHELRTPLNGMIGFLQLVLDGMCDTPEEERDFLRQALECSRHLLGLINDVLDIAKIEAGKLALEITPVDPTTLFEEVYTLTHVQAAQRGIRLALEPPADRELRVRGDFGKIKQVLINLVGNSLKFTPRGTITVRAVPHPELGHCMFEVADTGIGIPEDRQKVIFEKFTQADGSTTRKYGGTGLGLAITRSLVELMGGIIGVHSEGEGRGTRMYFSLPVWNAEEEERPHDEEHGERIEGPTGGRLVLIVEDDAVFRRFLTAVLHGHGYRTVEARSAEGGWILARRLRPAVVLLDYALTCAENANLRTGWDLAERLTSDPKTRHIPLIFVTGFEGELLEKLKSTAFARKPEHLMKPVEASALVAKIEELIGSLEGRVVRLLMADADPSVGAYVRKVLPEERFHIEVATNGEECLHILRTQPRGFDLLLLDLMMPDVSGYDVLREMTLTGVAAELPVLVLTNFPEPRTEEERLLLEQGLVIDVLPKTSVHENPQLLPHIIDWHMQVTDEQDGYGPGERPEREAA